MINFKYLTLVLKSELLRCTGNITKSIFLTKEEIFYLNSNNCILSIINESNGKYLIEIDRTHFLALCN